MEEEGIQRELVSIIEDAPYFMDNGRDIEYRQIAAGSNSRSGAHSSCRMYSSAALFREEALLEKFVFSAGCRSNNHGCKGNSYTSVVENYK